MDSREITQTFSTLLPDYFGIFEFSLGILELFQHLSNGFVNYC